MERIDRFKVMWAKQAAQQSMFNMSPDGMDPIQLEQAAKDLALGLYEESSELAQAVTRYKAHVLKKPEVEKINVMDGVVDVIKYAMSIAQLYRISDEELYSAFQNKTDVIAVRAKGERLELERHTDLILVDVDNVIADLSGWQDKLNSARDGAPMNDETVKLLETLKEDFYRRGGFLNLPVIQGAAESLAQLRSLGWKIVLVSARPNWQYKRVYADTVQWLDKNNIPYDLILFNKDKAEAIYEHIFPARPAFMIEDRPKHAIEVANIGVNVLLYDWKYNKDMQQHDFIQRVVGWKEIVDVIGLPPRSDKDG